MEQNEVSLFELYTLFLFVLQSKHVSRNYEALESGFLYNLEDIFPVVNIKRFYCFIRNYALH